MMRSEPHEEDPNVNIVLRSRIMKVDDNEKQPEDSTSVDEAPTKEAEFDLECARETFMEAKKSFVDASTSRSKDRPKLEMDPSMLTKFLETCMKLLLLSDKRCIFNPYLSYINYQSRYDFLSQECTQSEAVT